MKRSLLFGLMVFALSCDDGDLEIETVDFESANLQKCGTTVQTNTANVFFKINGDEALILELPANILKNEVTESDIVSAVPGESQVTYRIFSDDVAADYFCSGVPLTEPTVTSEIVAESGSVLISTTTTDDLTYTHTIRLDDISLVTGDNTRITDLRINDFGTVTTTTE